MIKHAILTISALSLALPFAATADDQKEYVPTTEIKTIDGKEYRVTYDAVQDGDADVDRDRESGEHVHARVFPLVNHKQHDDEKRTKFVYGPGFALVRGEESDTHSELEVVKLPGFRLIDTESHKDGRFDNKFLKVPILGSMFRHYRTDDKEKTRFLIFSHTKHLDDDGKKIKRKDRRRHRHQSRGKGQRHESARINISN
jgi:hypothetical protein